jgi:hypothetical protein
MACLSQNDTGPFIRKLLKTLLLAYLESVMPCWSRMQAKTKKWSCHKGY